MENGDGSGGNKRGKDKVSQSPDNVTGTGEPTQITSRGMGAP